MTTTTDTEIPLPEWCTEGAKAVLFSGHGRKSITTVTVARLTKTLVVCRDKDGRETRISRKGLRKRNDAYAPDVELLALTDPRVLKARAEVRRRNLAHELEVLGRELRDCTSYPGRDKPAHRPAAEILDDMESRIQETRKALLKLEPPE